MTAPPHEAGVLYEKFMRLGLYRDAVKIAEAAVVFEKNLSTRESLDRARTWSIKLESAKNLHEKRMVLE